MTVFRECVSLRVLSSLVRVLRSLRAEGLEYERRHGLDHRGEAHRVVHAVEQRVVVALRGVRVRRDERAGLCGERVADRRLAGAVVLRRQDSMSSSGHDRQITQKDSHQVKLRHTCSPGVPTQKHLSSSFGTSARWLLAPCATIALW
jgi:hypothetical protein